MTAIDKPNLVLPLASSYNERGVAGYTHAVTNVEDQIKKNSIYEPVKNTMTGKGTLTLSKRPGITINSSITSLGFAAQVNYLICRNLNAPLRTDPLIFSTFGTDIVANGLTVTSAGGGFTPRFVQVVKTYSAGVGTEAILLQIAAGEVTQRVHHSTNASTWQQISDGDFTALSLVGKMEQIDGYLFGLDVGSMIWNSDLNSLSAYTSTSFLAKQIKQDRGVGLAKQGNQLLAFGEETVEGFYNAGNSSGSPLGRLTHIANNIGMVNTSLSPTSYYGSGIDYYCTIGKRIYFVGREAGALNSIGLFSYEGGTFTRASSSYIDKILSEKSASIFSVYAISVLGQEAVAISFAGNVGTPFPLTNWLMFFPEWKDWFEWTSTVFSPVNSGTWFLASSNNAAPYRVYRFAASDIWQDNGTSYEWLTQFRVPSNGSSRQIMSMYGVDADTDTSANTIAVAASDDDNASFYSLGTLDLTQDRKVLFRGGSYRKRHIRLSATDARPKRIHNFMAKIG